jgi:8-hydroxy-5-deazaflavin:NADPH oxidoreductase
MTTEPMLQPTRRDLLRLAGGGIAFFGLAAMPLRALAQAAPGAAPLKIATIGAGREGGTLGTLFAKAGHPVMFSSRHPEQLKDLVAGAGPSAKAGTVAEAVAFGDVVLIVVPYTAIEQIGKDHGAELARKQLVMDVSNPIAQRDGDAIVKWVEEQGGAGLATAKLLPGAHVVRGFNAIGFGQLAGLAHRQSDPVGVPIAGDDAAALAVASRLIKEIGFEPVVVGGLAMGKYLVPRTALGGVHTPDEIRQIVATLK